MPISTTKTPRTVWQGNPPSSDHQPDLGEVTELHDEMLANGAAGLALDEAVDRISALESIGATGVQYASGGPVAAATTGNVTLSGEQTIDGVTTSTDRVLVKDQTAPAENGIYVTAAGAWARASDMDAAGEVESIAVYVAGGTTHGGMNFATYSEVTTLGTDAITFVQIGGNDGIQDQIDVRPKMVETPAGAIAPYLSDDLGLAVPLDSGVVANSDGGIETKNMRISHREGKLGIFAFDEIFEVVLGEPNPDEIDPTTISTTDLFIDAQYAAAEAAAETEAARLNAQDVSGLARRAIDAAAAKVLRIGTGQSFMSASDNARLMFSSSRLALLKFDSIPAQMVSTDTRTVSTGATWTPFNGGDDTLNDIHENFIGPTGEDTIYSDTDVALGNYPANARGGTPETSREVVSWTMRNAWDLRAMTDATQAWQTVSMNHAKTDGSIAEVGSGDGWLRMADMIDKFVTATAGSTRLCDLIDINHGEADEALGTATYKVDVETFYDDIWGELQTDLGQSDPPAMVSLQVGGPRYGSAEMVAANAQVDMMVDLTGTSANIFLVGCKYELPSFHFVDSGTSDHPSAGDGHPTLAGNVLMGIRSGIAAHFIQDRKEPYWVPFPFKCYFEDDKFLLAVPCKFPPLRQVPMVCGHEIVIRDDLGITFEDGGGSPNLVTSARVVPGYNYLIEGRCAASIAGTTTVKTGKRTGPSDFSGFTNIRDSFEIDAFPFQLPFDKNQIRYANALFGAGGDTGEGYIDDRTDTDDGRYLEDILGWVGNPDLGNPMARRTLTAEAFPA